MSHARGLRLFVALELPFEVRTRLAAWAREALGVVLADHFGAGEGRRGAGRGRGGRAGSAGAARGDGRGRGDRARGLGAARGDGGRGPVPESRRRPPARALAADSLHLTLCFLGRREPAELPGLEAAVAAVAAAPVAEVGDLSVGGPVWLPPRRPRALAVEVRDEEARLERMQRALSEQLASASAWEPERRRWRPHVTVARLRAAQRAQPLPATPGMSFTPAALVLYRSQLHPDGARYDPLAEHALAPG